MSLKTIDRKTKEIKRCFLPTHWSNVCQRVAVRGGFWYLMWFCSVGSGH